MRVVGECLSICGMWFLEWRVCFVRRWGGVIVRFLGGVDGEDKKGVGRLDRTALFRTRGD